MLKSATLFTCRLSLEDYFDEDDVMEDDEESREEGGRRKNSIPQNMDKRIAAVTVTTGTF